MPQWVKKYKACDQAFKCNICNNMLNHNLGELDHIQKLEHDGSNCYHNLQVVHADCHSLKTSFQKRSNPPVQAKIETAVPVDFKHTEPTSWQNRFANLFTKNNCSVSDECVASMAKFAAFCEQRRNGLVSTKNNYEQLIVAFFDTLKNQNTPLFTMRRIFIELDEFCQSFSQLQSRPSDLAAEMSEIRTARAIVRNKYSSPLVSCS